MEWRLLVQAAYCVAFSDIFSALCSFSASFYQDIASKLTLVARTGLRNAQLDREFPSSEVALLRSIGSVRALEDVLDCLKRCLRLVCICALSAIAHVPACACVL